MWFLEEDGPHRPAPDPAPTIKRPTVLRRVGRLRVALVVVAIGVALLTPPAALAVDAARHESAHPAATKAAQPPRAAPRTGARETPKALAQSTAPSLPGVTGPLPARVGDVLDRQEAALVTGDLAGFLAPSDPANLALRGELSRRLASLRAMRVAVWDG